RSYGVEVARLAGVPPPVVARARALLAELEAGAGPAARQPHVAAPQLSLFAAPEERLRRELAAVEPERLAPLEALALLARLVAARHGPAQILSRRHGTALSLNWAGNAASGTTFTDVKGTWTEPAVTCSKNQVQIASFWVGIDGFTSNTVEQIGADADCVHGQP